LVLPEDDVVDEDDFDSKPTPSGRSRRPPLVLSDSASRRRQRAFVQGIPVVTEALELLLSVQRTPEDDALINALRESSEVDPYAIGVTLAKVIVAGQKKQQSGSREMETAVANAVKDQDDRVKRIEAKLSRWDKIILAAAIAVAGALVAIGDRIWARSAHETETEYRLRAVEKACETPDRGHRKDTP
jgi:hypothetical protein